MLCTLLLLRWLVPVLRPPAVSPSADSGTALLVEDVMLYGDGGLRGFACGDCVALRDGVPQLSAASGRDCDASRAGGLRSIAASERDCVAPGDGELRVSAFPGSERDAL